MSVFQVRGEWPRGAVAALALPGRTPVGRPVPARRRQGPARQLLRGSQLVSARDLLKGTVLLRHRDCKPCDLWKLRMCRCSCHTDGSSGVSLLLAAGPERAAPGRSPAQTARRAAAHSYPFTMLPEQQHLNLVLHLIPSLEEVSGFHRPQVASGWQLARSLTAVT